MQRTAGIRRWFTAIALVVGLTVGSVSIAQPASAAPDPGGPCAGAKPFPDVAKSSQFCEAIEWAADEAIIGGYPDGTFRGGQAMTRIALAAVLFRYVTGQTTGPCNGTSGYKDVPASHELCKAARWAKDNHVIKADGSGNLRPAEVVDREMIAVVLYRSVSLLGLPPIILVQCVIGIIPELSIFSGFSDVGVFSPHCGEIKFMKDFNISQGYDVAGDLPAYKPDLALSRQAVVAFIFRYDQVFFH